MTEPVKPTSHEIVVYTPPIKPAEFLAHRELRIRVEAAYTRGIQDLEIRHLIQQQPQLAVDAYDLAMAAEKAGKKDVADVIRKQVVSITPTSPKSPSDSDPRFLTPKLTGPYPVGVKRYYLEDVSRNEKDLGHGVDRTRRVMIDVHYPAVQNKEPEYRLQPSHLYNDPLKVIGGWARSQPDLDPVPEEKFPVVLFSPGLGYPHDLYQQIVEDLSSHGFCVVTVNSPVVSGNTPFLGSNQETLPEVSGEEEGIQQLDVETMNKAKDMEFIVSQIKNDGIEGLKSIIDTENIGVLGHSLGGAAAAQVLRRDTTGGVKAGINLDGTHRGDDSAEPFKKPFLNVTSKESFDATRDDAIQEGTFEKWQKFQEANYFHQLTLQNADHLDFTSDDLYDFSNVSPERSAQVKDFSSRYITEFFKVHLKGEPSELFNEKTICKVIETYDRVLSLEKASNRLLGDF